ncbi:cytochrome P450 4C1-like [Macrosteles quadrilineatus]|uniref:cytochrome P450 4C1-like n=1 Tax=Macrosteles quadrilineatus TaxID=74068 RepID=UPI0023E21521|nr:cytochrome P450 4C1-like [Macrosteles quadrilineatus]
MSGILSNLILIFVVLKCVIIIYQWKCKKLLLLADTLPVVHPKKWIIGNIDLFLPKNKILFNVESFTKCLCDFLKQAAEKRFPVFCLWIGPKPLVFIQDPSDIQAILNNSKSINKGYEATKIIFGEGLIMAPGPKWKKSRKLINPIFHPSSLKKMVPVWNDSSSRLVEQLDSQVNGGPIDLFPQVVAASIRSICGDALPSYLLQALRDVMTEDELQDEMKTLFGTEDLYNEIITYTGDQSQEVQLEDLDNLHLLHRVIKETLRMFLVVPLVPRKLDEDFTLRGCTFPKGETVILSIAGLHYDPEVYPNPGQFDPDRHCIEEVQKRHPYSFLPFGGGPRNCIGKNFAFLSLKISLIHILKAFKITSKVNIEELTYVYRTTLASVDGYFVELQRRGA